MSRTLWVPGVPIPQGSHRAFLHKGRPRITDSNPRMKPWRRAIASTALRLDLPPFAGAVSLSCLFVMPCPKADANKREREEVLPIRRPDLDKLIRSVGDALTGIWWADDSQIVEIHAAKTFSRPARKSGSGCGLLLEAREFQDPLQMGLDLGG
jgi:crossover junction endodeoxyribonuclease RusA